MTHSSIPVLFQLHAAHTRAIAAQADRYESRLVARALRLGAHACDPAALLGVGAAVFALVVAFARIGGAL